MRDVPFTHGLRRSYDQNRVAGVAHDFFRNAAEHPTFNARPAMCAHGDETLGVRLREMNDFIRA